MESCHPQQAGLSVCTVSALPLIVDTPVCPPLVSKCVCLRVRVCVRTRGCPCLVGNDFERRSDTPRNSQYHPISADWNQHGAAAAVVIGRNVLLLQSFGPATFLSFFFATTCFLLGMCRMMADGRDLPQERLSQGEGGGGGWWGGGAYFHGFGVGGFLCARQMTPCSACTCFAKKRANIVGGVVVISCHIPSSPLCSPSSCATDFDEVACGES